VLALIPLVGPISSGVLVSFVILLQSPGDALVVAIYYLIYLQVEAYLISPRIMKRAVQVPAPIVVIAALIGGTLMGVLGALVAIPTAASLLLIVREIWMPRQQQR
jgi:predicted PurR-regulated permease PerM